MMISEIAAWASAARSLLWWQYANIVMVVSVLMTTGRNNGDFEIRAVKNTMMAGIIENAPKSSVPDMKWPSSGKY